MPFCIYRHQGMVQRFRHKIRSTPNGARDHRDLDVLVAANIQASCKGEGGGGGGGRGVHTAATGVWWLE